MTKEFGRMSNPKLLDKVASCGIVEPILSWFSSYFSFRNPVSQVNSFKSRPRLVCSSDIQGIIMGLLLFLLYTRDVFNVVRNGFPFLFAGGTKFVYTSHPKALESTISNMLQDRCIPSLGKRLDDGILRWKTVSLSKMPYAPRSTKNW